MKRRMIQRDLDRAAHELDKKGYRDLADKVDRYCAMLMKATKDSQVKMVRAALEKVNKEADRRNGVVEEDPKQDRKARLTKLRERLDARKKEARDRKRRLALLRLRKRRAKKKEEDSKSERGSSSLRLARLRRLRNRRR